MLLASWLALGSVSFATPINPQSRHMDASVALSVPQAFNHTTTTYSIRDASNSTSIAPRFASADAVGWIGKKGDNTYYIHNIDQWNVELDERRNENQRAVWVLQHQLKIRLGKSYQFSAWGYEWQTDKTFLIVTTKDIKKEHIIEESIRRAGGPSISINKGDQSFNPAELHVAGPAGKRIWFSLWEIAWMYPRPFSLFFDKFQEVQRATKTGPWEVTLLSSYLGDICLGPGGLKQGEGCNQETCRPYQPFPLKCEPN